MSRCCDARRLPAAAASEKCEKCASWLKRFQVEQSEVTCGKNKRDDEGEPEEEDGAMKICGACGLEPRQELLQQQAVAAVEAEAAVQGMRGQKHVTSRRGRRQSTGGLMAISMRSLGLLLWKLGTIAGTGVIRGQPVEPRSPCRCKSQTTSMRETRGHRRRRDLQHLLGCVR